MPSPRLRPRDRRLARFAAGDRRGPARPTGHAATQRRRICAGPKPGQIIGLEGARAIAELRVMSARNPQENGHTLASTGKKKTTMAKLARESRLRERRLEKQARKDARKQAAAHPPGQPSDPSSGGQQ